MQAAMIQRSTWEFSISVHKQQEEREILGIDWVFVTSKPTPIGTGLPTRPYLLAQNHTS